MCAGNGITLHLARSAHYSISGAHSLYWPGSIDISCENRTPPKSCLFEGDISADALRVGNGQSSGANGAGDAVGLGEQERDVVAIERHGALWQCGLHEGEAAGDE